MNNKETPIGFTLIELIVVIFIIGIVSSAIVLHNGNRQGMSESKHFAEQLTTQLQTIKEQANSQLKTFGLSIQNDHYDFYQYTEHADKQWVPLKDTDNFWRSYPIPTDIQIKLTITRALIHKKQSEPQPQIVILPTGKMTGFTLTIQNKTASQPLQIIGNTDGSILLQGVT